MSFAFFSAKVHLVAVGEQVAVAGGAKVAHPLAGRSVLKKEEMVTN